MSNQARRLERFLTQPFFVTEQFTGQTGRLVPLEDALEGCERILNDEFANWPEHALYMIGADFGGAGTDELKVWLPAEMLFEEEVSRIRAEAENGWFGMLPKHIDFVTALVPGVMTFRALRQAGRVPRGRPRHPGEVRRGSPVSTRKAVRGTSLDELKQEVERQFLAQQEREKAARALEAKLEADLVRRLLEVEKMRNG